MQCMKCQKVIEYPDSPPASKGFCPHCGSTLEQPSVLLGHEADFGIRLFKNGKTDQRSIKAH
jgi:hypothetical protein